MDSIANIKKERLKLSPEQLFNVYLECNAPQAPVKTILARYGLNPWDLVAIRKKVKVAAMETLAHPGKQGRKQQIVAVDQYQKVCKQLDETKDALAAVGHELALLKKKDELGLKGPIKGHYRVEVKKAMVTVVHESIAQGLTQKQACDILGIPPRKFRRWTNPKPHKPRTAWNKIRDEERDAIEAAAWMPDLIGKPVSHIFVHGHNSGKFFASFSTVYRVLKEKNLVQPLDRRPRTAPYVNAHALLEDGFSLLCYDGTLFKTNTGIAVWAIPVMILPQRYLLHIGHSINGISAGDLSRSISEAHALLPQHLAEKLIAHSDRGSAMKARSTKEFVKELLGAPVHFGRPHTPDDQAWIEAFIKTLKYHRDVPESFNLVDDILQWLQRFPAIYNNDPHSSLSYVTPLQALQGQKEVILNQRKQNLEEARMLRYTAWKSAYMPLPAALEVVLQPV